MTSPSLQDYVKTIFSLTDEAEEPTTQNIALRLGVSPAAVSKMIRRMAGLELVVHERYQSVSLTPAGAAMALETIRHHRLLERYFVERLGYTWDEVHAEAERLEHHISEALESRIDEMLDHPSVCPHGDPIPAADGSFVREPDFQLGSQAASSSVVVSRVRDEDPMLLRFCQRNGLIPGALVTLLELEEFGGSLVVRVGGETIRIGREAAARIMVRTAKPE